MRVSLLSWCVVLAAGSNCRTGTCGDTDFDDTTMLMQMFAKKRIERSRPDDPEQIRAIQEAIDTGLEKLSSVVQDGNKKDVHKTIDEKRFQEEDDDEHPGVDEKEEEEEDEDETKTGEDEHPGVDKKGLQEDSIDMGSLDSDGKKVNEANHTEANKKDGFEDTKKTAKKAIKWVRAGDNKTVTEDKKTDKKAEKKNETSSPSFHDPDPDLLVWDDSDGVAVPYNGRNVTLLEGWLKVPLVHDPHLSELIPSPHICLRVRGIPAADDDAPNGPLLLHCGGPGSGHDCVTSGLGPPKRTSRKFDQWSISQRGIDPRSKSQYIPSLQGITYVPWKDCPFKDAFEISPIACSSTMGLSQESFFQRLGIKKGDAVFTEVIDPIMRKRGLDAVGLNNETFVHWYYHLMKLEQELCYNEKRYKLESPNTSRVYNTLDYVSTEDAAMDIDLFREAIGAPKLSIWGMSYGTSVGATYATLFADKVDRLVLDANVPPYPDIVKRAQEAAMGGQSVWDALASECGSSLALGLNQSEVCPAAPDATTKVLSIIRGKDKEKAVQMYNLVQAAIMQKDVPLASVLMACVESAHKGTFNKGCNAALLPSMTSSKDSVTSSNASALLSILVHESAEPVALADISGTVAELFAISRTDSANISSLGNGSLNGSSNNLALNPKAASKAASASQAVSASAPAPLANKSASKAASASASAPVAVTDYYGVSAIAAIIGLDVAGRVTEESVVEWWKSARNVVPFGVQRGLIYLVGCGTWPATPRPTPPFGSAHVKPLVVGNLYDLQTSYASTQWMSEQFPEGVLMTWQGYGHCLSRPANRADVIEQFEDDIANGKPVKYTNEAAKFLCAHLVYEYLDNGTYPTDGHTCKRAGPMNLSLARAVELLPVAAR